MFRKKTIPIFFACDDAFVKYTIVATQSMIENASKDYHYHIHVLHTNVCDKMQAKLLKLQNENFEITFDDVTDYLLSISDKLPIRDYYSKTTYFRLFIADMFPQYDKVIYLDSDIIVTGDISELYNHNLMDNYIGAAHDQVIVQTDVFGQYAEKVTGISRHNFFSAGVLLINCEAFRKVDMLEQFTKLLHTYTFVVIQDEDYLNVLCKGHVLFLNQQWNAQVYGELPCKEEDVKIWHFIMASKPWHHKDCPMSEYFWSYAKKTEVYDEIIHVLENYTDAQRKRDQDSGDRLKELAVSEINNPNNYVNLMKSKVKQSPERRAILKKMAQYEKEGRFDEDLEDDPPSRTLMPDEVDYLSRKLSSKIKRRFAYMAGRVFLRDIIRSEKMIIKDIVGIEHMQNLKSGAVITCNHFNPYDSFAIQVAYDRSKQRRRTFYRVIKEGNYTSFPGFYGMLMRNCNTLPLSSSFKTMQNFMHAIDKVLKDGNFVLVYPEQSLWWNYRKPKPLKNGAYNFATKNQVPVLPCFITMEDSNRLDEDGFYVQEYTIHIAPPIYPDPAKSKIENIDAMRDENYRIWKEIYEETYQIPLHYSCDER
jgi:lipopolysaccharide biosynthesis glycosyltransferase